MKKWTKIQDMGEEIAKRDVLTKLERSSGRRELNAANCSHIASVVVKSYRNNKRKTIRQIKNGTMINETRYRTSIQHQSAGLNSEERERARKILKSIFRWHWFPCSKIRKNMRRLA